MFMFRKLSAQEENTAVDGAVNADVLVAVRELRKTKIFDFCLDELNNKSFWNIDRASIIKNIGVCSKRMPIIRIVFPYTYSVYINCICHHSHCSMKIVFKATII